MTQRDKTLNWMGLPARIQSVREATNYFDESPALMSNKPIAEVDGPSGANAHFRHPPVGEFMGGDFRKAPIARRGELADTTKFGSESQSLPTDSFRVLKRRDKLSDNIAARLKQDLQQKFRLSETQAAAIVGNLDHESGGFRDLEEIGRGGRGGVGYAQWTGPRRKLFEDWSKARGLDPTSYEANFGYLEHELRSEDWDEFINTLHVTDDLQSATKLVSDTFLSPNENLAHLERRQNAAANAVKLPNYETDTPYDHRPWRTPIPRSRP